MGSQGEACTMRFVARPSALPYLGGDILLRVHVGTQPEVLHVCRFLFAFVREVEHLLRSRGLLCVEGKEEVSMNEY